jgi:hypothetical protein
MEGDVMKTNVKRSILKFALASAFVLAGAAMTADSNAATATGNATATVVTPIAIANANPDLAFGSFSSAAGGTVTVTPASVRSAVGPLLLTSTVTAATFHVTGSNVGSPTYAITLPAAPVTISSGANTMTVDTFTSSPSGTSALTAGADDLNVGATLHAGAGQAAGSYTGSFSVSVDYN